MSVSVSPPFQPSRRLQNLWLLTPIGKLVVLQPPKICRLLPSWVTLFRLDRYFSDKAVQINLSNLVGLMENSRIWWVIYSWKKWYSRITGNMLLYLASARLRQLIINRTCPRFTPSLRKSALLDSELRVFLINTFQCPLIESMNALSIHHCIWICYYHFQMLRVDACFTSACSIGT